MQTTDPYGNGSVPYWGPVFGLRVWGSSDLDVPPCTTVLKKG